MNMNTESAVVTINVEAAIMAAVTEAMAKDRHYMDTHASFGSVFTHCSRLMAYLSLEGRAAVELGLVGITMQSEHHTPSLTTEGNLAAVDAAKWADAKKKVSNYGGSWSWMRAGSDR